MPMGVSILPNIDVSPLDRLLVGFDGKLRPVRADDVKRFPRAMVQLWCVKRGVYQLPTVELIDWLALALSSRRGLEICGGNGVLGRELLIPVTDSYMQVEPAMAAYYRALGQEPISPPPDVIKMDAYTAVREFRPQVVIGAWVTQKYQEGDRDGSVCGVDEFDLLTQCETYIHVGNDGPHGTKRSLKLPHTKYRFDWLISRANDQSLNHITVWGQWPTGHKS